MPMAFEKRDRRTTLDRWLYPEFFTLECRHLRIADNYWFVFLCFLFGFFASVKAQLVKTDLCSILGLGRSPGEGNGNPLQYFCLENPMDGGAWRATVHGVAKSRTRLSNFTFMHWRRKWQPTPVLLPGESQGRRSLVGCHLWGHTESDTTEVT